MDGIFCVSLVTLFQCCIQQTEGPQALLFRCPWDYNLWGMWGRGGRIQRHRQKGVIQWDQEVWVERKCNTDGGGQTERQGGRELGSNVTWRNGRGSTATGITHIFLLFTSVLALRLSLCFHSFEPYLPQSYRLFPYGKTTWTWARVQSITSAHFVFIEVTNGVCLLTFS